VIAGCKGNNSKIIVDSVQEIVTVVKVKERYGSKWLITVHILTHSKAGAII
jgi:hypothetical protein